MDNKQNPPIEVKKEETETITVLAAEENSMETADTEDSLHGENRTDEPADPSQQESSVDNGEENNGDDNTSPEDDCGEEQSDEINTSAEDETILPASQKHKWLGITAVCLAAVLMIAGILGGVYIYTTTRPITVEVDELPNPEGIHSHPFLASLYAVEPYSVDVSKPGQNEIGLRFFGFLPGSVKILVRDTIPPVLKVTNVHTVVGTEITWEDFVLSCTDKTETFMESGRIPCDTVGEHTVTLTAWDAASNRTTVDVTLTVWDDSHILAAELNAADLAQVMKEKHPEVTEMDLDDISTGVVGEYILHASSPDASYVWPVKVADTTPPVLECGRVTLRPGETAEADDFVVNVEDVSLRQVSFAAVPDFTKTGLQSVTIAAEDSYGNRTEKIAKLFIADFPKALSLEYGVTEEEIREAVYGNSAQEHRFRLSELSTEIGQYDVTAQSTHDLYTVQLTIADTVPPILTLTDQTIFRGDSVQLDGFVVSAEDLNSVTVTYTMEEPGTDELGDIPVSITATDAYGNKTTSKTVLHVIADTTPPVIYGTANRTIVVGESVSFKKGVYAVDARDGDLTFQVNSSAVNTNTPGTYPVVYTSTDTSGNTATKTVYLTVIRVTMEMVNGLADNVLWSIINNTMDQRQKAEAIYNWCTASLTYSTRTSYLMGNYIDGAYSGFNIRSGNCYIYYAVSSVLLTRAGLENMMVQRDDPANPHYWSLVNIDGDWYHFDTCPHYAGHDLRCFLLTDDEVGAYSEQEVPGYYSYDSSLYPSTP